MRDGKALQAGTSHYLGQKFSKAFGVKFQTRDQKEEFAYTTSWAISSRIIGALIMTHGDDKGLMMPPNIAPIQVVIIPVGRKDNFEEMVNEGEKLAAELRGQGVRVKVDKRDGVTNGFKYNDWELKGIPVRIELGPRDLEQGVVVVKNRTSEDKETLGRAEAVSGITARLSEIQAFLLKRATDFMLDNTVTVDSYDEFKAAIEDGKWVRAFHCGDAESERADQGRHQGDGSQHSRWTTPSSSPNLRRASACTRASPPLTASASSSGGSTEPGPLKALGRASGGPAAKLSA